MSSQVGSNAPWGTAAVTGSTKLPLTLRGLSERATNLGTNSLVLALFLPLTLVTRRSVQRFMVALLVLDIPLRLEHNYGYQSGPADLGAVGGFGISVTTIALAALYAGWIIESIANHGRSGRAVNYSLALAFYVLISALSLLVARDMLVGFFDVWILFQSFLMFVYFANRVQTRDDALFIMRVLLIGLAFESAIILALEAGMRFEVPGHPLIVAEDAVGHYSRIAGTLGSPTVVAGYLSLLIPPALSLMASPLGRWDKRLVLLAFGAGSVALVFTFSRGAWMAVVVSLAIMGGVMWRQGRLRLRTLVLFSLAMLGASLLLRDQIATRILGDDKGSALVRLDLMRVALSMIRDHPLLGVGANNYPLVMGQYYKAGEWFYSVHDKYLLVWSEVGIFGLLAFLGFLIGTIRRGVRLWAVQDPMISALAIGLTAAIIGHMTHLFVDIFRGRVEAQLLWLMASLIVALGRIGFRARETALPTP